jgi:hypothetical protein
VCQVWISEGFGVSRSSQANRYGTLAEKHLCRDRGLDRDGTHTAWCDAEFRNGTPVEIKSAMVSTGYFQIYEKYHSRLRDEGGWYGFVVYRPAGRGIKVLKSKMVHSSNLPLSTWSPTGGHRGSDKATVPFSRIF